MLTDAKTKPSLLLVEDSEDDAYFFGRTLQKSGLTCSLHRANNGAEAVDYLQNASAGHSEALPQIIFLDLKMPVLNGFEVLDWLRHQTFANQMRVVVLSGSEHQHDRDRAAELGAVDYLVKPVKTGDLDRFLKDFCPSETKAGAAP